MADADVIEDLQKRVSALEAAQKQTAETQTWMAQTLDRIAAVQDDHTKRLDKLTEDVSAVQTDVAKLHREFRDFRDDFPSIVADVVRGVMKPDSSQS